MVNEDDDIRRWLEIAGPRLQVPDEQSAVVRDAVHRAWRNDLRRRVWQRRTALGGLMLAAAAVLAVVVLQRDRANDPVTTPVVAIARFVSVSGSVTADGVVVRPGDAVPAKEIRVADAGSAALSLTGGGEWRLDGGTIVTLAAPRTVSLERGAIYVDSGTAASPVLVRTPLGDVRDVGTRFEVRLEDRTVRVRVRDGAIRFESTGSPYDAAAGREIVVRPDRSIDERAIARYDSAWAWTTRAAPFQVDGQTLSAFLGWAAVEGGRPVRFADPRVEPQLATVRLHGSISGLTVEEALTVILPTCGLTHRIDGGQLLILRQ